MPPETSRLRKLLAGWILISSLLAIEVAVAQSPVWQISKGDRQLYLGGTVHILSSADYPLPVEFDRAYAAATRVVFETDISAATSPAFQQKMLSQMSYSDGRTLQDVLSKQTWRELSAYCEQAGLPLIAIERFKPGLLTITITVLELQRLGVIAAGVDEHFQSRALADGKPVGELETADQQLSFLANMGKGREDELISYTLDQVSDVARIMGDLKQAWRSGDLATLEAIGIDKMIKDFPNMYRNLLVNRNNAWMPKIENLLATDEVELVLVGALHLAGKDGLLQQLRNRGYLVTAM